jgi:FAD dependent oxidoreductase TIGR03364
MRRTAIVVGAGIVGLATARALSLRNFDVTIIERDHKANGASIRNFGMIWPIGQPAGKLYNRAIQSKAIWKETATKSGLWYNESGSLHLAYEEDEWQVLKEVYNIFSSSDRPVQLLNAEEIAAAYDAVNHQNLVGGLFSPVEMVVDPREAMIKVSHFLMQSLNVKFIWGSNVTKVNSNKVMFGDNLLAADLIFICNGADFETLYPEHFRDANITKCKLQMMRFKSTSSDFRLGPSLCGGLSLIHYKSFLEAPSLSSLQQRYREQMPAYTSHGIHVMVSQNQVGELTVGDSHEYSLSPDPFDRAEINRMITSYLAQFVNTSNWQLVQTWNGIYPKMLNDNPDLFIEPDAGVYILNGLGGAGMTLSFGFAEEAIASIIT